jgi:phage tail-like protein
MTNGDRFEELNPNSSYQEYLPAILQTDNFLGEFLLAFERILSGLPHDRDPGLPRVIESDDPHPPGLEEVIEQVYNYFDPQRTPEEFLPWLASWVALSLRADWTTETKRQLIQEIVPLYRKRGTKQALETILKIYFKSSGLFSDPIDKVKIYDNFPQLPHYFQVELTFPNQDREVYWRQVRIAKAIIDLEKPAHTYYALNIITPTMRLTGTSVPFTWNLQTDVNGMIEVRVNNPSQLRLRVSVKMMSSRTEPLAATTGTNPELSLVYEVRSKQLKASKNWYILIDNLNDNSVSVSGRAICKSSASPQNTSETPFNLTLEPGLKIGRGDNGTRLGTVRSGNV